MIRSCATDEDFEALLAASDARPVWLFKHSTTCPVSAHAHGEFRAHADAAPAEHWLNRVIEERPLARRIAAVTGVEHQSPQAILFFRRRPVWHASHGDITADALGAAERAAV